MVVELIHAQWGSYRQLGIAPKFSLTPGTLRSHAPELGEHTTEILTSRGFTLQAIAALQDQGVV
jgi:crotonobetainyl-CoA:carnitine CoA-transferase CaiB-like acyl-CoA transferase